MNTSKSETMVLLFYQFSGRTNYAWDSEICGMGMAIVLASLSYYLVEKPFLNMKDAFTQKTLQLQQYARERA